MSFTSISSAIIAAGKPVTQELCTTIKDDLDDLDSRIAITEGGIGRLPPICFDVVGALNSPLTMDGALIYRLEANTHITAARLLVKTAGSSGSVTVDIEYKRGAGAWTSILTGTISSSYSAGNYAVTSGTLAVQDFLTGDLLRLNIDAVQTNMEDFSVYLENEVA